MEWNGPVLWLFFFPPCSGSLPHCLPTGFSRSQVVMHPKKGKITQHGHNPQQFLHYSQHKCKYQPPNVFGKNAPHTPMGRDISKICLVITKHFGAHHVKLKHCHIICFQNHRIQIYKTNPLRSWVSRPMPSQENMRSLPCWRPFGAWDFPQWWFSQKLAKPYPCKMANP